MVDRERSRAGIMGSPRPADRAASRSSTDVPPRLPVLSCLEKMHVSTRRLVVLAVSACLMLSGCQGESSEDGGVTSTATTTVTKTPAAPSPSSTTSSSPTSPSSSVTTPRTTAAKKAEPQKKRCRYGRSPSGRCKTAPEPSVTTEDRPWCEDVPASQCSPYPPDPDADCPRGCPGGVPGPISPEASAYPEYPEYPEPSCTDAGVCSEGEEPQPEQTPRTADAEDEPTLQQCQSPQTGGEYEACKQKFPHDKIYMEPGDV